MKFNENLFKREAKKQILKCRPGDWNHAKRVVLWIKRLGRENKNIDLIIVAGYIHDIGWMGILSENKISFKELLKFEKKANKNSGKFAPEFLKIQNFSHKDISIILRLIKAADKHSSNSENEAIIVDSDNLSKLSINHIKEKYEQREWIKMYEFFKKWVPKRIKTLKGKKAAPILLKKLEKQIPPG